MKVLILEDDALSADFIEKLILDNYPDFKIVGKVVSVKEASRLYNNTHPDLLIMDINLGDHTSFELFDYIDASRLFVLFISSYQEYALKAIKVEAIDYLLKPIVLDEFKKAIEKVFFRLKAKYLAENEELNKVIRKGFNAEKIFIYEGDVFNPVELNKIIKIKSQGAYSTIFKVEGKKIVSSKNLGLFEKVLENKNFIRIHDSCLINYNHIQKYSAGVAAYVTLSDNSIESISRRRKRHFVDNYIKK